MPYPVVIHKDRKSDYGVTVPIDRGNRPGEDVEVGNLELVVVVERRIRQE